MMGDVIVGSCVHCGGKLVYHSQKSYVHVETMSLYLCPHGKDPKLCCGEDGHCALVRRSELE